MVKTKTLEVKGMHCASCAVNVKKAIENTPGVIDANVNIATNKATITYDPSQADLQLVLKNVEKIGYSLSLEGEKENSDYLKAKKRIIASLAIMIPSFGLMLLEMTGLTMIPFMDYIDLVLSFAMIFVIGYEVQKRAFKSLIHGSTNMDLLIALGTIASFATGVMKVFGLNITNFSYVGAMIMLFHLLGKFLEETAKGRASRAIKSLLELGAKTARIIADEKEVEVDVSELDVGDIMVVRPGEKIPTDGVVIEGFTSIDESMATGESIPLNKSAGDPVIGGTINQSGLVKVKATKVGDATFLSQLIKLVEEAQGSKVPIQEFADRITAYFVPVVILISVLTFGFWFIFPETGKHIAVWASTFIPWVNPSLNRLSYAIFSSVATLVIACPCALGLATPTALMVGSGLGARNGILIRNGEAIQTMKDVTTVVFDKTGTLTKGEPKVTDIFEYEKESFKIFASLERNSNHPIARAIADRANKENVKLLEVNEFLESPGQGVTGKIENRNFSATKISDKHSLNNNTLSIVESLEENGKTVVALFRNKNVLGIFGISDTPKENAKEIIAKIKNTGLEVIMITGDNNRTAHSIARELSIDKVFAEVLPQDKINIVKQLQQAGKVVAFVGDGINDAPTIKQANVGIAMGTGTDIAIEAGDIVLVKGNLENVIKAINLSRATFTKIKQNLFWALFYNIIAIPIAAMGLLHPAIAEIAMAFSSINVVTNSIRLSKIKI